VKKMGKGRGEFPSRREATCSGKGGKDEEIDWRECAKNSHLSKNKGLKINLVGSMRIDGVQKGIPILGVQARQYKD